MSCIISSFEGSGDPSRPDWAKGLFENALANQNGNFIIIITWFIKMSLHNDLQLSIQITIMSIIGRFITSRNSRRRTLHKDEIEIFELCQMVTLLDFLKGDTQFLISNLEIFETFGKRKVCLELDTSKMH